MSKYTIKFKFKMYKFKTNSISQYSQPPPPKVQKDKF